MSGNGSLMDRLRAETRKEHMWLEDLPFFRALAVGDLALASYVGLLRALNLVYEELEQCLSRHPQLATVWNTGLRKLPLIDNDLAYFQRYNLPITTVAMIRAHLLAQAIRQHSHNDPLVLLGYLYVLEGSTLGGLVLQQQVAQKFSLNGSDGLAYLSSYGKATKAHWKAFSEQMNNVAMGGAERDRVIAAALEAFNGIGHIVEALYPFEPEPPRDLARELNPAAGSHAVTTDPRELQAALLAGERSLQEFPYYQWRYGERGVQFTRSDSAWLVTLAAYKQPVADQQIGWLGRVLASRGMPRWLLEQHLDVLYEELVTAVPERQQMYQRLKQSTEGLREQRCRYINDQALATLIAAFDNHVGDDWSARLPKTGGLLAAAVADEKAGIAKAVTSIESWITDAERFPSHWIAAVQATIQMARTYIHSEHR